MPAQRARRAEQHRRHQETAREADRQCGGVVIDAAPRHGGVRQGLQHAAGEQTQAQAGEPERARQRDRQGQRQHRRRGADHHPEPRLQRGIYDVRVGPDERRLHRDQDDQQVDVAARIVVGADPEGHERAVPQEDGGADGGGEQPGERQELASHQLRAPVLVLPKQPAQPRHGRAHRVAVDRHGRARRVCGEDIRRHGGGRHHRSEDQDVAREQQLADQVAAREPAGEAQQVPRVGAGGAGHAEPRDVGPGQHPEAEPAHAGDRDLRAGDAHEAQARVHRPGRKRAADHVQGGLQLHALVAEVHPLEGRFRQDGETGEQRRAQRERGREPQRPVQRGRRAGDRRRHPRDDGGRGDGEGQEDQPDDERCAQGAAVILGGGGLAVRDHQPQRFRRPAADGRQVAGEPPQHLPHTEQPGPQPVHQQRREHQAHAGLDAQVEGERDAVE